MMNFYPLNRTKYSLAMPLMVVLISCFQILNGQHGWSVNSADYQYNCDVNAIVSLEGVEVTSGTLGAFVGDECRGYADGEVFDPTGKFVFSFLCYSDLNGEEISFRYYDSQEDKVYNVLETLTFESNAVIGDKFAPISYSYVTTNSSPSADCPDYSTMSTDAGPHDFDMETIFSDVDGDELTFTADASAGSAILNLETNMVQFEAAASGVSVLTLTASDAEYTVSCVYTFTIDPTNDAPEVQNAVADLGLEEGFVSQEIDLSSVFTDADSDPLTYSAISSDIDVATVNVSGDKLLISEIGTGNVEITISASDGKESAKDVFNLIVLANISSTTWDFNAGDYSYEGSIIAEVQVNGDAVSSGVLGAFVGADCVGKVEGIYFDPTGKCVFSLDVYGNIAAGDFLSFRYYHSLTGVIKRIEEFVEFKPGMQLGSEADPLELHILDANHLPSIDNPISDFSEDEHFNSTSIGLVDVFSDSDGDVLSYFVSVSDASIAEGNIFETDLILTEVSSGATQVIVSASDGEFVMDNIFEFTINEVNDAPIIVGPIDEVNYDEDFRSVSLDVSGVFEDPDGDELTYGISLDGESVITAYFSESNVIIREVGLGTANLNLCVSDGEFQTCHNIEVHVNEVNDAPEIYCMYFMDTCMVEGGGNFIIKDICDSVYDEEGDPLTYTASSSAMGVASVAVSSCDLVVSEVGLGVTTIEFCVSDGVSKVCCSFEFEIKEENELIIAYMGNVVGFQDSIMVNSEETDVIIDVTSGVEWSFVTYSEWIHSEMVDETTLKLTCVENKTGEWRMGLAIVKDAQKHEAPFYVRQSEYGTEIVNVNSEFNISLYPNPTSGELRLESKGLERGEYELALMDNSGKILKKWNKTLGEELLSLDVSALSDGVYFIRLSDYSGDYYALPFVKR